MPAHTGTQRFDDEPVVGGGLLLGAIIKHVSMIRSSLVWYEDKILIFAEDRLFPSERISSAFRMMKSVNVRLCSLIRIWVGLAKIFPPISSLLGMDLTSV